MSTAYRLLNRLKASPAMAWPRRWNFEVRSLVAREPKLWYLYQPYIWWDIKNITSRGIATAQERVVGPHTEIVIDGFQGSANSFAAAAFQYCQTRPVALAHHMHSPTQIIQAIDLEIPVIITVRAPQAATLSLTSRWSHLSVAQGLRSYTHFYRKLLPYADHFVISTFEQTTAHFDDVIRETNRRFETHFDVFENTEANLNAVRKPERFVKEAWKRRQENKKRKARAFETDNVQRLLAKAEAVHRDYLQRVAVRQVVVE